MGRAREHIHRLRPFKAIACLTEQLDIAGKGTRIAGLEKIWACKKASMGTGRKASAHHAHLYIWRRAKAPGLSMSIF